MSFAQLGPVRVERRHLQPLLQLVSLEVLVELGGRDRPRLRYVDRVEQLINLTCSEPGGLACCYWNRYGSSATTRLKDSRSSILLTGMLNVVRTT